MTRKEAKEMLPIIQAFANGETIECNSEINPDKWYMVDKEDDELKFDRSPESYRIKNKCKNKPEQRSSIWERLKICWSVLTKSNYIYFGVSKNPVEWNEDGSYKRLKRGCLKSYNCVSYDLHFETNKGVSNLHDLVWSTVEEFARRAQNGEF